MMIEDGLYRCMANSSEKRLLINKMKKRLTSVLGLLLTSGTVLSQSLTIELTNSILSESTGTLQNWGRVSIPSPEATNITITLASSDATEIAVTGSIAIVAGETSAQFDVTALDDSISDGLQLVDITASAGGYADSTGTVDVADTGTGAPGGMPRIAFDVPTILDRFTLESFELNLEGSYSDLRDCSGCCVSSAKDELLVVLRDDSFDYIIHVYDLDGTYKRLITLNGFEDIEGICEYDTATERFGIVEEDRNRITLVTIADTTTTLNQWDYEAVEMGLSFDIVNKGIEGISHDPLNGCFYAVQEGSSDTNMAAYRTLTNGATTTVEMFDAERVFRASGLCTDLSDLTYDPYSGHLFILSDEGKMAFECDLSGNILASRALDDPIPDQPEGIALSHAGKYLYVISEPDEYYRYSLDHPTGTVSEGTVLQIPVRITAAYTSTVTVDFVVSSTNAILGVDYSPAGGTLTFDPGSVSESIIINILADLAVEEVEHLRIALTNAVNASPGVDTVYAYTISNACPLSPTLHDVPFDNMETPNSTPWFEFNADDPDGVSPIVYQIEWSTDPAFLVDVATRTSDTDPGFENREDGGDSSPFTEGQRIRFTVQPGDELTNSAPDEAYYWRIRAKDDDGDGGSGVYGAWTTTQSLRVNTGLTSTQWHQTADGQFATDTLLQTITNGLGSVAMSLAPVSAILSAESFESGAINGDWLNSGSNDGDWIVRQGSTPSSGTGPSSAQDGNWYVYVETSRSSPMGRGSKTAILVGPEINVDDYVSVSVDFWYHMYGDSADLGTLYCEIYDGSWNTEWSASGNAGNGWHNQVVDITSYSGTITPRLMIVTGSGGSYHGDTALDNIVITGTNPPNTVVFSSPIDLDWAPWATAWNQLLFTDDETNGVVTYDVQYWDGDSWENTSITNKGVSPVDISALDSVTCNRIRLKATMAKDTDTPHLHDWTVTWIESLDLIIQVASAHGAAVPPAGTSYHVPDSEVTCIVTNNIVPGTAGIRYACTGWVGTASVPASGSSTNTGPFTITEDSTITWQWQTNFYLDTEINGAGTVDTTDSWYETGEEVLITASNGQYYSLAGWNGDTAGCTPAGDTLTVPMDQPRQITADFSENLATNQTPEWWLAGYYGTNDFDAEAMSDTDGDGMAAWQEYRAGTLPTNFSSALKISALSTEPSGFNICWLSTTGRMYAIHKSTNLVAGWDAQPLATNIPASGTGSTDHTDPNPKPVETFYRIILE